MENTRPRIVEKDWGHLRKSWGRRSWSTFQWTVSNARRSGWCAIPHQVVNGNHIHILLHIRILECRITIWSLPQSEIWRKEQRIENKHTLPKEGQQKDNFRISISCNPLVVYVGTLFFLSCFHGYSVLVHPILTYSSRCWVEGTIKPSLTKILI